MNVLDLFSGIGGFSLGLERAGMRTVAFCEIEAACHPVLAAQWPHVPIYSDVRKLTAAHLSAAGVVPDLIAGGFPCQDASFANIGGSGTSGARTGLYAEAKLEPDSSWRTCQVCLIEGLEKFSGHWPTSGLMRSGNAFRRETLELITFETGFGSWPTPAARDGKDLSRTTAFLSARKRHSPSIATRLLQTGVHWSRVSTFYEASMGFPLGWSVAVYTQSGTLSPRTSQKQSEPRHDES